MQPLPQAPRDPRTERSDPDRTRADEIEAERQFLELIRKARLPEPQTNVRIGRYEVDFFWPEPDLIFEIDGCAFHSTRDAFERDRRKDAELGAQGHRVKRGTWRQLVDEPEALVATLGVAYGQRMRGAMYESSARR